MNLLNDDFSSSWFNLLNSQSVFSDCDSYSSDLSNEYVSDDLKSSDNSDVSLDGDLWKGSDLDNM
jgi:hypothetical protein